MPSVNAYPDEVTAVVSGNEVIMVEVEGTGPQGAHGAIVYFNAIDDPPANPIKRH